MQTVDNRRASADAARLTPEETSRRAWAVQQQGDKLKPCPRLGGSGFKARTHAAYKMRRRRLLPPQGVRSLLIGGQTRMPHALARATGGMEVLTAPPEENCRRVFASPHLLADGAARELPPGDLFEPAVLEIADVVQGEVSPPASEVTYPAAAPTTQQVAVDSVTRPFLVQNRLLASKEPRREPDAGDRLGLRELRRCLAGLGAA